MKNPTVRQIARATGVSVATVSRVLSGRGPVAPGTARRIQNVAAALGWKPNPLAAAYMAHLRATVEPSYQATLGFLTNFPSDRMPLYSRTLFAAASERAAVYGYQTTLFSLADPDITPQSLDRVLYHRNINGLIISGFPQPNTRLTELNWSRYAAVTLGRILAEPPLHRVMVNYSCGFRLALDRLIALQYRRLAVISSTFYEEKVGYALSYVSSYIQTHLPPDVELHVLELENNAPKQVPRIQRWLREVRPDAIFGTAPSRDALVGMGWRIPRDVAFASPDRHPAFPDTAGFDQRYDLVGSLAADVLVALLTNNQRGIPAHNVDHLVEGRWVDGPEAPPAKPARRVRRPRSPG